VNSPPVVRYELADGVAHLTLDRPQVHNAFNEQMLDELQAIWQQIRRDDEVRAIVVTGAGERAFCAGLDRAEALGDGTAAPRRSPTPFSFDDPGKRLGPKSNDVWRPVIVSVNGLACGGAFYLLGEADIIIAAEHATFFDPHVTYGMASAFESIHMLPRLPLGELLRMQLLGSYERLSAQRAYEIGLVSEVAAAAELDATARRIAACIAAQPPLAVEATLRAIWRGVELPRTAALESAYGFVRLGNTPETVRQGQEQFAAGRRVEWRLR
jgi:enoyl-CoA hydratase/carnithine racemase